MSLRLVVTLFLFSSIAVFSQEKTKKHTISKGETVSSIAEKYEVKPSEIYKLNPKAKNLLKLNSVLLIPTVAEKNTNFKTKIAANYSEKEHEVLAKETLYGIAKEYGITLKELNQANPTLETSGLKIGQKITIPGNAKSNTEIAVAPQSKNTSQNTVVEAVSQSSETTNSNSEFTSIEVLPKESKYSITRKYGITIQEFNNANPKLGVKSLKVGQKVLIPANAVVTAEIGVSTEKTTVNPKEEITIIQSKKEKFKVEIGEKNQPSEITSSTFDNTVREVLPKETKYGIAKQYGITVQELERQNPEIKNSLPVGYTLNIKSGISSHQNLSALAVEKDEKRSASNFQEKEEESNFEPRENSGFKSFQKPVSNPNFLEDLIKTASSNIGSRYQTGGTSKSGFDCSGLMCTTFGAFDIKLPRTSIEQSRLGTVVTPQDAQKGDLIFFKTNGRSRINHVGMVVEVSDGDIKFIHASVGGGVVISSVKEKYYEKKLTQINRVLQ